MWGSSVVVPPRGRKGVLMELHEGHPGMACMKSLVRMYVWRPTLVGPCILGCISLNISTCRAYNALQTNTSELVNFELCRKHNRDGQLCGSCMEGYAPPVYSYSTSCVQCKESDFKLNVFRYVAVAFLPLTIFYFIIIIFKGDFRSFTC